MVSSVVAGASPGRALPGPAVDGGWYRDVTGFARHTHWLQPIMTAYTTLGIVLLCALVATAWWAARRRGDLAGMTAVAWTCCATVIVAGASAGLKQVFTETRPCLAIDGVTTVAGCPGPTDYSFPSNHTAVAAALAAGVWLAGRTLGLVAGAAALLEGFSRVYLGQHYPHDVAAGLALAALIVLAGWPPARRPLSRLLRRVATGPLRPLVVATGREPTQPYGPMPVPGPDPAGPGTRCPSASGT